MAQRVSKLSALVNTTRCLAAAMRTDSTREGELFEQRLQSMNILTNIGIELRICSLEIHIRHDCRSTMSRPTQIEHVNVPLNDDSVQMRIKKR